MLKKIFLRVSTIFTAVVLSGCINPENPSPIQTSQYMEANLAQLVLPLSDEIKETQIVRVSTAQMKDNGKSVLIEQHAFKGGRITALFAFVGESSKKIIFKITDSPYVKSYLGEERILGEVKKAKQSAFVGTSFWGKDYGDIRYLMVTNPKKTKYCVVFSIDAIVVEGSDFWAYTPVLGPFTQKYRSVKIDGALCDSARNKNIYVMEAYAKRFISTMKITWL